MERVRCQHRGTDGVSVQSNEGMILLDTEDHIFLGHDYADLTQQLLAHLTVQDDNDLAALAAACLNCTALDVMIVRSPE